MSKIFISPSYESPNPANSISVENVSALNRSGEVYDAHVKNQMTNQRPFLFGPPPAVPGAIYPPQDPNYVPCFNQSFTFMCTKRYNVTGVLHNSLTLEDTIIFY